MGDDFLLFFRHIPKTGGTSILYHFRQHLGDDRVVTYGPHSRTSRFFQNKLQLEEMTDEDLREIRVIQGHGVDEETLCRIPFHKRKIMVILREPVRLTRSRYNQRCIGAQRMRRTVDEADFLENAASDILTKQLITGFPSFADDPEASDRDKAFSILKKIDFVFTTEQLNAQTPALMQQLGIPTEMEKRRVAEKKVELGVSDEYLASINTIDTELFQACNHVDTAAGATHNPLGFDADGKERVIRKLMEENPRPELDREALYQQLSQSLCRELLAEAAITRLETRKDRKAVQDPDLFLDILKTEWEAGKADLNAESLTLSRQKAVKRNRKLKHETRSAAAERPSSKQHA